MAETETVESHIPDRMDRLPWARWHRLVVAALGSRLRSAGPHEHGERNLRCDRTITSRRLAPTASAACRDGGCAA